MDDLPFSLRRGGGTPRSGPAGELATRFRNLIQSPLRAGILRHLSASADEICSVLQPNSRASGPGLSFAVGERAALRSVMSPGRCPSQSRSECVTHPQASSTISPRPSNAQLATRNIYLSCQSMNASDSAALFTCTLSGSPPECPPETW